MLMYDEPSSAAASNMCRRQAIAIGTCLALILAACASTGFDTMPYTDAVVTQFDDGEIMNTDQATCVANAVEPSIDWQALDTKGLGPDEVFADTALTERLDGGEIDALIESIDTCRGAADVVLAIFQLDGAMEELQLGCFASQMTQQSSHDLLRLIMADDQAAFTGSEGELLLGICGQGTRG